VNSVSEKIFHGFDAAYVALLRPDAANVGGGKAVLHRQNPCSRKENTVIQKQQTQAAKCPNSTSSKLKSKKAFKALP